MKCLPLLSSLVCVAYEGDWSAPDRSEPLNVGGDSVPIHRHIVVVDPILPRHHRIEALGVEIAIVDLMPPGAQRPDQLRMQGGAETRLDRVSE